MQATHMLAGLGDIRVPHSQQRIWCCAGASLGVISSILQDDMISLDYQQSWFNICSDTYESQLVLDWNLLSMVADFYAFKL